MTFTPGQTVRVTGNSEGNPDGKHHLVLNTLAEVVGAGDDVVLVKGQGNDKPFSGRTIHQAVLHSDLVAINAFANFDEFLRAVLELLPEAVVDEDNDGQLIIYTNLTHSVGEDSPIVSMGD